jgi:cell division septation protein DedD
VSRSPAEQFAVNRLPIDIPPGPRYVVHHVMVASRAGRHGHGHETLVRTAAIDRHHRNHAGPAPVELAEAPEPRAPLSHTTLRTAYAMPASHHGFHIIEPAMASESMGRHASGSAWAIQVGAYSSASQAHAAAGAARNATSHAQMVVASVKTGHAMLYRARLSGMSHEAAVHACQKLAHGHGGCVVVAPSA